MRNAVAPIRAWAGRAEVEGNSRTRRGVIAAADGGVRGGGTGGPTGGKGTGGSSTGGSGTGGRDFYDTGGSGTGGNGQTGGSNFGTGGGGVAQVCPTAVGGAGGQSPNAPALQPAVNYRMLGYPSASAIADVNGDSRPGRAVATHLPPVTAGVAG